MENEVLARSKTRNRKTMTTESPIELFESLTQDKPNWKLVREHDNLTKYSVDIKWLEWDSNNKFKAKHNKPAIGYSLIMSPFNAFFTWQTTPITEIIKQQKHYIKFKTKNSIYELFKLKQRQ